MGSTPKSNLFGVNFGSFEIKNQSIVDACADVWSEDPFSVKGENGLQIVMP